MFFISIRKKKIFQCLLCLAFLVVFVGPLSASQGTIIVLYGTPCAGKSTLAAVLAEKLPGDFQIVKKTALADEKRRKVIENATGECVLKHADLIEKAHSLSPELKKQAMAASSEALKEVLQTVGERADRGENLIFDVCMKDPKPINQLGDRKVVKIFVYVPLPVVSKRDFQRASAHKQSAFFHHRRRNSILSMYISLVRPTNSSEYPIDWISLGELEGYFNETEKNLAYPQLKQTVIDAMERFNLNKQRVVGIVPVVQPDILVYSHKMTPIEAAEYVKEELLKKEQPKFIPLPVWSRQEPISLYSYGN